MEGESDSSKGGCDWARAASESAAEAKQALQSLGRNNGTAGATEGETSSPTSSKDETRCTTPTNLPSAGKPDSTTPLSESPGKRSLLSAMLHLDTATAGEASLRRTQSDTSGSARSHSMNMGTEVQVRQTKSDDYMGRTSKTAERKVDEYGFIVNMDDQGNVYDDRFTAEEEKIPTFAQTKLRERREKKWNGMLSSWGTTKKRRKKLLKRLRKGVPNALRGRVWCLLGNVEQNIRVRQVGLYNELVLESTRNESHLNNGHLDNSADSLSLGDAVNSAKSFRQVQETIERDIHRTYPRHSMFHEDSAYSDSDDDLLSTLCDEEVSSWIAELEGFHREAGGSHQNKKKLNDALARGGQASLRRVLKAYSLYDSEVGYCQGMNFIAGMFLTFTSEEEAFWLLVAVMHNPPCRMRGMFGRDMQATHQVLYVAEKLIHQFLPRLAKHLDKENVHITMYGTQWLLTLYTSSFQFDLVTRVWDCFLAEGWKVVYRVMLALLSQSAPVLMTLGFEEILAYFRDLPDKVEGQAVMEAALKIPLKRKHLKKYEKEWLANQQ